MCAATWLWLSWLPSPRRDAVHSGRAVWRQRCSVWPSKGVLGPVLETADHWAMQPVLLRAAHCLPTNSACVVLRHIAVTVPKLLHHCCRPRLLVHGAGHVWLQIHFRPLMRRCGSCKQSNWRSRQLSSCAAAMPPQRWLLQTLLGRRGQSLPPLKPPSCSYPVRSGCTHAADAQASSRPFTCELQLPWIMVVRASCSCRLPV
jgi:hypothetical protein